jgi:hypothetical protein
MISAWDFMCHASLRIASADRRLIQFGLQTSVELCLGGEEAALAPWALMKQFFLVSLLEVATLLMSI